MTAIWNLGALPSIAPHYRIAAETAAGAGGYLTLSRFLYIDDNADVYYYGADPNKRLIMKEVAHNTLGSLTAGMTFSRLDGGELAAVFGWNNGGLAFAAREGFVWATGGGGLYGNTAEAMRMAPDGRLIIGGAGAAPQATLDVRGDQWVRPTNSSAYLHFYTPLAYPSISFCNQDRMRFVHNDTTAVAELTSAGSLGLNVLSPALRLHVRSNVEIARFETTTVRGSGLGFIGIGDPTGRKGYWGYGGGNDTMYLINDMNDALHFGTAGNSRWVINAAGTYYPVSDNGQSAGASSNRISVVYAATGTINTSDEREKKWRGKLTKAELAAGIAILDELGIYQWNDAIKEKGKDARLHFGARAQRVWSIMADHKLVAPLKNGKPGKTAYAFLCYDKWDDEFEDEMVDKKVRKYRDVTTESTLIDSKTGEPIKAVKKEAYYENDRVKSGKKIQTRVAGDRFGLRPDQFTLFLIAVQAEQIRIGAEERAALAARLDAIEKALKASD